MEFITALPWAELALWAGALLLIDIGVIRELAIGASLGVAVIILTNLILLPVAIYGGYFNGGLGIVLLAVFAMWGMTDLHQMNGLKCWLSFALSVISFVIFAVGGKIVWIPALVMGVGTILGGLAGAPVARRIPMPMLRALIAASEGRRQEQINIATGEREAFIARSEGEKQAEINKAQGEAAAAAKPSARPPCSADEGPHAARPSSPTRFAGRRHDEHDRGHPSPPSS